MTAFSDLLGKTLTQIVLAEDKETVEFFTADGQTYRQFHCQDCCEGVSVEEIVGDLADLIGTPILQAEEVTHTGDDGDSSDWPEGVEKEGRYFESYTWTFYKLATIKGSVTIRWFGSSNGYYSESVDFALIEGAK